MALQGIRCFTLNEPATQNTATTAAGNGTTDMHRTRPTPVYRIPQNLLRHEVLSGEDASDDFEGRGGIRNQNSTWSLAWSSLT